MIENAVFMRVREKACLNGVQMEYDAFLTSSKDAAIFDCQLEFSAESQNGNHSDANETHPCTCIEFDLEYELECGQLPTETALNILQSVHH
jgi:hypothetical protein